MEIEGTQVVGRRAVAASGRGRQGLLDDQGAIQAAGGAAAQDLIQDLQGVGVLAALAVIARRQIGDRDARLAHPRAPQGHAARGVRRRLRGALALGYGPGRDLPVVGLGERTQLGRGHVAGDDQHGVVRRVPAPVEGERGFRVERVDLVLPADDGNPVRVVQIERGLHHLAQLGAGIVVDPAAPLFQDHLAFGQHDLVGQLEMGHAVGLVFHDDLEAVAGHGLVVAGVIVAGEGVLLTAVERDDARELARSQGVGTLEHEMLEEMGVARFAGRLVGGADLVPEHVGDDGRTAVGDDHHLQAVVEGEGLGIEDARLDPRRARRPQADEGRGGEDQPGAADGAGETKSRVHPTSG